MCVKNEQKKLRSLRWLWCTQLKLTGMTVCKVCTSVEAVTKCATHCSRATLNYSYHGNKYGVRKAIRVCSPIESSASTCPIVQLHKIMKIATSNFNTYQPVAVLLFPERVLDNVVFIQLSSRGCGFSSWAGEELKFCRWIFRRLAVWEI